MLEPTKGYESGKNKPMNRMLNPEELPPLNPDEFQTIFNRAAKASAGEIKVPDLSERGLVIEEDDGSATPVQFTDHPVNKMAMSILQEYGPDNDMFQNILFRIFGLMKMLHNPSVREALTKGNDNDSIFIHPAAIEAAALLPLDKENYFNAREFIRKAKKIAEEKYPELN